MSRPTPSPASSPGPLLAALVDDAAVFPPGSASLPDAVAQHLQRRSGPWAPFVGPLLVPAGSARELSDLAAATLHAGGDPLPVALVVRPGAGDASRQAIDAAIDVLAEDPHVLVTGIELGHDPGWLAALEIGVPVAVEVSLPGNPGDAHALHGALDDIAVALDEDHDVVAKYRTGATPDWPWPDETRLAGFLDAALTRGLPFKLTGGLHHALRRGAGSEPMHGLVNVLLAVHAGREGADVTELAEILALTEAERMVLTLAGLSDEAARELRGSFTSFGCCGVLDPLTELAALGLIDTTDTGTDDIHDTAGTHHTTSTPGTDAEDA